MPTMCERDNVARALLAIITEHGAFVFCNHHALTAMRQLDSEGSLYSVLPMHTATEEDGDKVSTTMDDIVPFTFKDEQTGEGQF